MHMHMHMYMYMDIMLLSGMLSGCRPAHPHATRRRYLVGVFCTLAAASPSVQAFRDELSQLNNFMAAYSLNPGLRFRLREFLHETVHLRNAEARRVLLAKLSPAMQVWHVACACGMCMWHVHAACACGMRMWPVHVHVLSPAMQVPPLAAHPSPLASVAV